MNFWSGFYGSAVHSMLTHHGSPVRNTDLCARFCTQNRGTSLKSLIAYAQQAGLQARPLRLDLPDPGSPKR